MKLLEALAADFEELAALAASEVGACWTALGVALQALERIDDYEGGVLWAISLGGANILDARIHTCHAREKEIPKQKTKYLTVREKLA